MRAWSASPSISARSSRRPAPSRTSVAATALDGVETVFLIGRDNPDQVEQHGRVLDAARAAGARHVVKLSAVGARPESPVALDALAPRDRAAAARVAVRVDVPAPAPVHAEPLRSAGDVAERSRIAAPMGDGRYPLVDTRDVGAASAAVLRDPEPHAGRTYTLTGPAALRYADVARGIGDLVARPVEYEARPPGDFRAALVEAGIPEWRADDLAAIAAAYTDVENIPSPDLPKLIGRRATPLDQFLSDHREPYLAGLARTHL